MIKVACARDEIKSLTSHQIKFLLDKDDKGEYLLLDVREPTEYQAGHIPGALLVPLGELEARQGELDRSKRIIAYCRSGNRSMAAATALCGLGFKSIYHLDGGILAWQYETIAGMPEAKPHFITEAADARDIFMLAMKLEKGSWNFYLRARDKAQAKAVKETFQTLADAEDGHMTRLYREAVSLLGDQALMPLEKIKQELKVDYIEGGIEISPALARIGEKFRDEMEALEIALEKEYMAYDFYKRISVIVEKASAKFVLHELVLEERKHADILLLRLQEIVGQQ